MVEGSPSCCCCARQVLELTGDRWKEYCTATNNACRDVILPLMNHNPEHLEKIDFFKGIPDKKLHLLSSLLKYVALRSNDVLFEEGSLGNSLFILIHGRCDAVAKVLPHFFGAQACGSFVLAGACRMRRARIRFCTSSKMAISSVRFCGGSLCVCVHCLARVAPC